jgi:predicted nucleotidyltransferase
MAVATREWLAGLRSQFEQLYGQRLVKMLLYGSQARGDADIGSDIDILVVLRGPVRPGEEIARTGPVTAALSLTHDVVISCVFMSDDRFRNEQSPLLLNARREGVPL